MGSGSCSGGCRGAGDAGLCVSSTSGPRHGCATWFKQSWAVCLCWHGLRVLARCLALLDEHQQPATVNPQPPPAKSARTCLLAPEPFQLAVPCTCSSPQKSPPALPVNLQSWAVCPCACTSWVLTCRTGACEQRNPLWPWQLCSPISWIFF